MKTNVEQATKQNKPNASKVLNTPEASSPHELLGLGAGLWLQKSRVLRNFKTIAYLLF